MRMVAAMNDFSHRCEMGSESMAQVAPGSGYSVDLSPMTGCALCASENQRDWENQDPQAVSSGNKTQTLPSSTYFADGDRAIDSMY